MKRCTVCGEEKNISEFASAGKGKLRAQCKPCLARKKREYYKKHPHKARRRNLKTNYGIDVVTFDRMADNQNHSCAICLKPCNDLVVDHNHSTSKVRGLLCHNCNLGLGHFQECIATIINATAYLRKHNELQSRTIE